MFALTLKKLTIAPIYLALLSPLTHIEAQTANSYRTVRDTELGSMFTYPAGFPWSDLGAYMGAGQHSTLLAPEALKGHYGHFNHFGPFDDQLGFPYEKLRGYEASEVAAGRNPIFVTATYAGKKRPVMYSTYLNLNASGYPTSSSSNWVYAVNIADERFIKFWLNEYARPSELLPMQGMNNVWLYVDGAQFNYGAYGVLDDSGKFISGVAWDAPFQQNVQEYLSSCAYFFNRVHQIAPDIKFNTDLGSMSDPTQFPTIYANIPGALGEDDYAWVSSPSQSGRDRYYLQNMQWFPWMAQNNRVGIMGANLPAKWQGQPLIDAFAMYEMLKGSNFFFAPRYGNDTTPVPPSAWEPWNAALGSPVGAFQTTTPKVTYGTTGISTRLYWRQYTNGYVYVNWTGTKQTITLPAGNWVDPYNNPVTKIVLSNISATFVTAAGTYASTVPAPAISPRTANSIQGPVTVTITSSVTGATIRYTTNGTVPTSSSPLYTGPFQLNSNAVVQASAFASGYNASGVSAASYTVTAGAPTVQFGTTSDYGYSVSADCYPVLALSSISSGPVVVTYSVQPASGPATVGTATFTPGEVFHFFPVPVSGSVTVTITQATGAVIGTANTFQYSVLN